MQDAVLVTGGCGYIGSHVVRRLGECGHAVVIVDDLSSGFRENLATDVPLLRQDVGDHQAMVAAMRHYGVRTVMHFAASISVPESVAQPLKYYDNNTSKTIALLRACADAGVREVLFSSTAAVYGESHARPVTEDDRCEPTSPYGRSKQMDEWILADVAGASGLRYVALRYFNVAGADPLLRMGQRAPGATHLIKVACEAALGRRPALTIFGGDYPTADGTCVRDFIHVEDLAEAHVSALAYLRTGGATSQVLNCGYGHGLSVRQIVEEVRRQVGRPFEVQVGPRRAGDIASLIADPSRMRRLLAWKPKFDDLSVIIESALAWERKVGV